VLPLLLVLPLALLFVPLLVLMLLIQVPSGPTSLFTAFDGTTTLAAPHTPCGPACGNAPAGTLHWDDGFTPRAALPDCTAAAAAAGGKGDPTPSLTMTVHDGPDKLQLELRQGFRYVQLYTGNAETGVAVEPMSSETNAFNNEDGLVVLEAGAVWQGEFRIKLKTTDAAAKPHILITLADDFGWANAGWHGNKTEAATPTLDGLVAEGIELDRHYVYKFARCAARRAARADAAHLSQASARPMTGMAAKMKKGDTKHTWPAR